MIAALQNHFEPKPLVIAQRFHFHGMEAADRNTKTLHAGTDLATVHKLSKQPTRNPTSVPKQSARQSCYRCGKSNHDSSSCRFIDATCRNCGKKGHISLRPVCKSTRLLQHRRKPQRTATNYLETEPTTEPTTERASSPPEELHMFALGANSSKSRPIYCDVLVEGTPTHHGGRYGSRSLRYLRNYMYTQITISRVQTCEDERSLKDVYA